MLHILTLTTADCRQHTIRLLKNQTSLKSNIKLIYALIH